MNEDCCGWLSKAQPPKSMLKAAAVRQKGPLSKCTPPRRMLRKNLSTTYFTQNSPPPPQLMTARKQSTLIDYFGVKEDKCRPRIKESPVQKKDMEPLSICSVEDFLCDNPLQISTEESHGDNIHEETSLKQNLDQTPVKNLSLSSNILKEKQLNVFGKSHVLQGQHQEMLTNMDFTVANSENCSAVADCSCNKENCLKNCREEYLPNKLQHMTSTVCTCFREEIAEDQKIVGLISSSNLTNAGEFVTFSEALQFLSDESVIVCNSSKSCTTCQDHSNVTEGGFLCSENAVSINGEEHLDSKRLDWFTKGSSNKSEKVSVQYLQSLAAGEVDVKYLGSDSLRANTDDVQACRQNNLSQQALKKCSDASSEWSYRDTDVRSEVDSYRDDDSIHFTLTNSSNDAVTFNSSESAVLNLSQLKHEAWQDMATPSFTDQPFTMCSLEYSGDVVNMSALSSVNDQLRMKKQKYMSDIGTLVFSEDM